MRRMLAGVAFSCLLLTGCVLEFDEAAAGGRRGEAPEGVSYSAQAPRKEAAEAPAAAPVEPPEEEPPEPGPDEMDAAELLAHYRIDDDFYAVDPARVVRSDEVRFGPDGIDRESMGDGHIANSYAITGSLSYLDHWYREFEAYYPLFTDEIPYEGSGAVKAYYEDAARTAEDDMERYFEEEFTGGEIAGGAMMLRHFTYRNYAVAYNGYYLAVIHDGESYAGGAHGSHYRYVENFDMRTGRLVLEDVLMTGEEAQAQFRRCMERYAGEQDFFDFNMDMPANFMVEGAGVRFLFNPYESGSFASGIREVLIPWEELADYLLIDPADARQSE